MRVVWPALAVLGFFAPGLLGGGALVYGTLTVIAIFAVMAYGLDIVLSDLGEVSLAHTAFFAAGAYAASLLAVDHQWGAWATLGGAIGASAVLALVLGLLTLRTREFAFSLVTYAASVVCAVVAANWSALGGSDGVVGVPLLDLSVAGLPLVAGTNVQLWPYAYGLLLVTMFMVSRFRRSRLGQAALMVHMNPRLAVMSGFDPQRVRLLVFLLSAPISAVAGWLYAYQRAYVGPGPVRHVFPGPDADGGDPRGPPDPRRAGARHRPARRPDELRLARQLRRQGAAGRGAVVHSLPVPGWPRQHPPATLRKGDDMSGFETIRCEREGPALVVTLNRPDRLNAFNPTMRTEMIAAFDRADADDAVRAVIVTGAGRGFCAGSDMAAGAVRLDPTHREGVTGPDGAIDWDSPALRDSGGLLTLRIFASLKPVIAAVNGPAVGVGATMLLPMDIRLAAEPARFGFAFTRRGLVPEACSSWFLPRVVGISRAMEWTLTGRVFDATEALAAGLVRSIHPPGDLLAAAHAIAAEIAAHTAPVAVALSRQMLWRMLGAEHPMMAHRVDSRFVARQAHGGDVTEGVAAFLEKRSPDFPNQVSTGLPPWLPPWTEPAYE